jgi:hypothetical protein
MANDDKIKNYYFPDKSGVNELLKQLDAIGSEENSFLNTMYGISPLQQGPIPLLASDDMTYVFFTRPDLNLSNENIIRDRHLTPLLNEAEESVQKYARMVLDPYWTEHNNIKSKIFNTYSPFINVFSNTIESLSGWPDEILESWISPNGMRKEQWGYADGINKIFYSFDLDMSFLNIADEPIPVIMDAWTTYMTNVRTGNMLPYYRNLSLRRIDYVSAIWVLVVSSNKRIKKIARTIGYPVANPKGRSFNYTRNEKKTGLFKTFNTKFKCFGAEYNDPILPLEFNMLMSSFDPRVKNVLYNNGKDLVEIPERYKALSQFKGVPVIDLRYNTLEFMIDSNLVEKKEIPNNYNK